LKTEEVSNLRLLVMNSFSAKMLANFRRKRRNGEKTYSASALFIGVRGGSFKKRLDMTVVIFPGDAFHSDVPRVTFFTRIRDFIHGIRSSESTRIPEGLVLGN
jgi:hypothetical protein